MIVRDQDAGGHVCTRGADRCSAPLSLAVMLLMLVTTSPATTSPATPADPAWRGPLVLTGPAEVEALGRHFEYTIDADWQRKPGDFTGPAAIDMAPLAGSVPDFGYTPARIWLRLAVVNQTAEIASWRFFVQANFTQKIAIYRIGSDGQPVALLDLAEDSPFAARPIRNPQMVAPFDLAPGDAATLLVAYYSQGASRISMSIETPESFEAPARVSEAKNHAFYGVMAVMIVLAMIAMAFLRQPVFAAYAAYLSSISLYIAHADGTAFQYLWPDFPRFNSMASVVAGSGVMVFGGLFAIAFLQTRRFHPRMHRVLLGAVASVLVIDIVLWASDPQLLKRLLVIMITALTLIFLAAGLVAARTRFREVRFYLFAWGAGLVPAILFTARFAFGIETTFITPYDAIRLALLVDALMMGLAIVDRYAHLRQSQTEQTLAHIQRSLTLGQRLSALEEQYAAATAMARRREDGMRDTVHDLRQPMQALRLSLGHMAGPQADTADVGQIEAALGSMERLVTERLERASPPEPIAPEPHDVPDAAKNV